MPHIVCKNYSLFQTPQKKEEYTYLWFGKDRENELHQVVGLLYEGEEFLLDIHPKKGKFVIKSDKITRPPTTHILKEALKNFCELAKCDILYDNLSQIKPSVAQKSKEFLKKVEFFIDSFPKDKEIWIEIGFGSGRHLLYQAKKHPDILFIGIEIHKPSIEQLLKQIALQKLDNIFVIDYDARLFLELVPSNAIGKIFVHFPVPWDKKPHRRVISKKFIDEAQRVLKHQGVLELRTDSQNYFDYALTLFLEQKRVKLEVMKNIEAAITSKYEDRWIRQGKDIFDIRIFSLEESADIVLFFDFIFKKRVDEEEVIRRINKQAQVFEDFFIHFQKVYIIEERGYLVELSFGSFNRPEHSYLLIEDGTIRYFAKRPVLSKSNIKAHKKIEELLYG